MHIQTMGWPISPCALLEERAARCILAGRTALGKDVWLAAVARGGVGVAIAAGWQSPLESTPYPPIPAHAYARLRLQLAPGPPHALYTCHADFQ